MADAKQIIVNSQYTIYTEELTLTAVRSQGAGGQNINKVSSAIHLRFDVNASSLSAEARQRILAKTHHLLTAEGIIIIKAQTARSQEKNRAVAVERLAEVLRQLLHQEKSRKTTRPTRASARRRLEAKTHRSDKKSLRGKVREL